MFKDKTTALGRGLTLFKWNHGEPKGKENAFNTSHKTVNK